MLKKIIHWSIDNRFIVIALAILISLIGFYTLLKTPVDAIPDLSDVQVIIKTPYAGQAPQLVEDQVTYPLTAAMLSVPGATTVRGYSFFGDSYVYVLFKDGTNPYWARTRVLEYLSQMSGKLPKGVKPQIGPDATGVGWVFQYALTDKTHKHDLSELTSLQNWTLKYELQSVPGVAEVATVGGMVKQYQITLDPNKLKAYKITLMQVSKAIQAANSEVGGSVSQMGEAEYMIRATGYIQKLSSLRKIPIAYRDGAPILLSQVATVNYGPQMRRGIAELNGEGETVGGIIVMRYGENALKTIQAVKKKLAQIQQSLPKGVKIVTAYDRSSLIHRAIETLTSTLTHEFILVILVCALFLFHFRSALVVLCSLPVALLIAFIIMYLQGINANIMSLGGIAIAVGVMVDGAIVMIENMHKKIEQHHQKKEAIDTWALTKSACTEVGPTLFFSLLIITLSFLPVFALQNQEGRLFTPLAFTKTYAMAASCFIAITLIPVLIGYFVRGKIRPEQANPLNRFFTFCYRPFIHLVLRFPKTLVLIAIVICIASYWPFAKLGSEFMPTLNEGDLMYMPTMLPGVSIDKAREVLQQTDKIIKQIPEVHTVMGKVGRAETATDPAPMTMIETIIRLKPQSEWPKGMTMEKLKSKLEKEVKFPGVTNAWVMPIRTRIDMLATGIKTPLGIKITGPKLGEIQRIGEQVTQILKKVKGTASAYADRSLGGRYIQIDINRSQAAMYGLNISDIQNVIKLAVGGANISETIEGRERYPINLRYPQKTRNNVSALKALPIVSKNGQHLTLGQLADVRITSGPPMIKSENAQLTGWVLVDIEGMSLGQYTTKVKQVLNDQLKLPAGYRLSYSGQYEYMHRATARLQLLIPLTLLLIFILLYLSTKSLIESVIVMGTVPMALIGGIWLLYFLNYNLSVAVGVGFIALAGLAVESGMLLLNYLNHALDKIKLQCKDENRALAQDDIKQAIIQGAGRRLRPILMTVATVFFGLMPVMMSTGTGSEVMRRIAAPMLGGLFSATVLTLIIIPAIYYVWKLRLTKHSQSTKNSNIIS